MSLSLFPRAPVLGMVLVSGFLLLSLINLLSLVGYSYPVTTTLGFNLRMAGSLWLARVMVLLVKVSSGSSVLPRNSPWYLVPFLCIVEIVSILVRPVTLCFRLLANMSAGHILLRLITKITFGLWLAGAVFGVLELMVSLVQAFVFLILTRVYFEETITH